MFLRPMEDNALLHRHRMLEFLSMSTFSPFFASSRFASERRLALCAAVGLLSACGAQPASENNSTALTVDVASTPAKWQSIQNPSIYAVSAWIESTILRSGGGKRDVSESYLTYRHFEDELLYNRNLVRLGDFGNWHAVASLVGRHGLMWEGDFIPAEAGRTYSVSQAKALKELNASLSHGPLSRSRAPEVVRVELDRAFGVRLDAVAGKIIRANHIKVRSALDGKAIPLSLEFNRWTAIPWPQNNATGQVSPQQAELLRAVQRHLANGAPIIVRWVLDMNALDGRGTLDAELLRKRGPGRQEPHMTVLEDFTASGVDPASGNRFEVGEGEVTPRLKRLAAERGFINALIVKNSWGGNDRPDVISHRRGGESGFLRLTRDYLFFTHRSTRPQPGSTNVERTLQEFVIPSQIQSQRSHTF